MKQRASLFFILPLLFVLKGYSQITITSENINLLGKTVIQATDNGPATSIIPGNEGSNKIWNFSALGADEFDTVHYVSPASLKWSDKVPDATLGLYYSSNDSLWQFLKKSSSALKLIANCNVNKTGDTNITNYDYSIISFPATMDKVYPEDVVDDEFDIVFQADPDGAGPHPFVDSLKLKYFIKTAREIDAWGTVITPIDSFDCLREKTERLEIDTMFMFANNEWTIISPEVASFGFDSVSVDSNLEVYTWWSNDPAINGSLLTMYYKSEQGVVDAVDWLFNTNTSINERKGKDPISVFPNPAAKEIYVDVQLNGKYIFILNGFDGRKVLNTPVKSANSAIRLDNMINGVYIYKILDINNNIKASGKLYIIK